MLINLLLVGNNIQIGTNFSYYISSKYIVAKSYLHTAFKVKGFQRKKSWALLWSCQLLLL